mgnify:CR=1 FL=1
MNVTSINGFVFEGNLNVQTNPDMVKDISTQLQDKEISVKLDISKEGMEALRKEVQAMPGHIEFEKQKKLREILPKLQMDPVGAHYEKMNAYSNDALAKIKEYNKNYGLEELFAVKMEGFVKQYRNTILGHEDGSRDIYVQESLEEFRKVELDEDLANLSQAFESSARSVSMFASVQEQRWQVRHLFYGEPELPVELPDDYQDRIEQMLTKVGEEFTNKYSDISDASEAQMITDAKAIASSILREDKEFYESMKILFGGNGR